MSKNIHDVKLLQPMRSRTPLVASI